MTRLSLMTAFGIWCFGVGAMVERGDRYWLPCLVLAVVTGTLLFVTTVEYAAEGAGR